MKGVAGNFFAKMTKNTDEKTKAYSSMMVLKMK